VSARIISRHFDPLQALAEHQATLVAGSFGACANFVGSMRDFNAGDQVSAMTLEHYPEMTQSYLDTLCIRTIERWSLVDALIIHRVGLIKPGESIVLTAAWAAHRAAAFDACRYLMEELKSNAPFWKKEVTDSGERWVHNAPDTSD
jgi:molybdopterin synthase catalytic subunit